MFEAFFGNGGDMWSTVIYFGFFILFIMFGPKLMAQQAILKLEKDAFEIEEMAKKSKKTVLKLVSKKPSRKIRESIDNFMEFFAVEPVATDPYGIMRKLDHIIKQADDRFDYFVNQIAPHFSKDEKKNLKCSLGGAITTYQIAKIVRHLLETIKKYKMFQMAMILQMQLPLIKNLAKSAEKATTAFADETPIGDSIGPLIVASMMKGKIKTYDYEEFAYVETKIGKKTIIFSKADGPGATIAKPGKFITKLAKKKKINRIITIDAGSKLEGEKSGSIAEGVGVIMNPAGTDRFEIEDFAVKKKIPLDGLAIKMSNEEALSPMKREIVNSVSKAIEVTKNNINRKKGKETILIIGVGNTCGIGNNHKEALEAEKKIRLYLRKHKKKKKKGIFK